MYTSGLHSCLILGDTWHLMKCTDHTTRHPSRPSFDALRDEQFWVCRLHCGGGLSIMKEYYERMSGTGENRTEMSICIYWTWCAWPHSLSCLYQKSSKRLPSGNLPQLWQITIFNGKTLYKSSFYVIFNSFVSHYQRVFSIGSLFWEIPARQMRSSGD